MLTDVIAPPIDDRAALVSRIRRRLWGHAMLANFVGATVVILFLVFLFPIELPEAEVDEALRRGLPVIGIYLLVTIPIGGFFAERYFRIIARWLRGGHAPTEEVRGLVLTYPRRWTLISFSLWLGGTATLAAALAGSRPVVLVGTVEVGLVGALVSCAMQYLVVEWIMRPVAALVLADGPAPTTTVLGIGKRLKLTWLLVTGIPLAAIAAITIQDVAGSVFDSERVVAATLAVALIGLWIGFVAMWYTARAVVDPLQSMREAVTRVARGDFATRIPVDDASEIGLLEAGFNSMTHGLAEREQLRQAFGTFVDPAVADRVLAEGTDLAGEEVEVTLVFLDIRGFTAFSERSEARTVVAMLNELFGLVVPVILRHGGHANKFIGDGLLAVFGAPQRLSDHADRAVAAARVISAVVRDQYGGEVTVGIGVNSGKVVVGTVGGGGRLDFTVIGDAVNTAARVETATRHTGDTVLITEHTLDLLGSDRGGWVERPSVPLKGKQAEVRLFAPVA